MVLAIVLAVMPRGDATVANPVLRAVSCSLPVDLPRHTRLRRLVFWGLVPTIYKNISSDPVQATFFLNIRTWHRTSGSRGRQSGPQQGRVPSRDHRPGISSVPEGSARNLGGPGDVVVDDHAAHGVAAGDARDHPAHRQRVPSACSRPPRWSPRCRSPGPVPVPNRNISAGDLQTRSAADRRLRLGVPAGHTHILMVGQFYSSELLLPAAPRANDRQTARALAKANS